MVTVGDGNCLFNAISNSLFSTQKVSPILRLLTAIELYMDADHYAEHPSLVVDGKDLFHLGFSFRNAEEKRLSKRERIRSEAQRKVLVNEGNSSFIRICVLSYILRWSLRAYSLMFIARVDLCGGRTFFTLMKAMQQRKKPSR